MNRTNEETHAEPGGGGSYEPAALNCPACGTAARRTDAHFCATCGRGLRERAYAPADSLLASYHQQRNRPSVLFEPASASGGVSGGGVVSVRGATRLRVFDNEGNTSAAIAFVLICSALVPFIGILFCPLAVFAGGVGLFEALLVPRVGGGRLAASCIGFGFLIGGAQVLLFQLV
jgi:ribosomal protein L37E